MGDTPALGNNDLIELDFYPFVTERRQSFEEWLQDRREAYKQIRRPDIPLPLVSAVEAFQFDQTFTMRGRPNDDFPDSELVFELDLRRDPDEFEETRDENSRAVIVHDVINS